MSYAYWLMQEFAGIMRELGGERLDEWLEKAKSCEIPALGCFGKGLK